MALNGPEETPLFIPRSHLTTEANKTGAWRFLRPRYDEKTAPCGVACPAGEDIARIQMLASQGLFKEAWETVLIENPLPGVCGRVCHHPCESVCNRAKFDEAVSIQLIERFLADTASRYELKAHLERIPSRNQRIALIGAGPSGLSAAWFLSLLGYDCDLYEAMPEPGGVLRWGIPAYRLPLNALRDEIRRLEELGVRIHCGIRFGEDTLARALTTHEAVLVACGLEPSRSLDLPGADLPGTGAGAELLRKVAEGNPPTLHGSVAVIGSGYIAIETARCAARLGAKALLVQDRKRTNMPGAREGLAMALEEGVEVLERMVPVSIEADGAEYLLTLREIHGSGAEAPTESEPEGETRQLRVSSIFNAGGLQASRPWMLPPEENDSALRLHNSVLLLRGNGPVAFIGDLVNTSRSVVHAIASGKEAAIALDLFFREGPEAVRPGMKLCTVGSGRSISMEAYMNGPRSHRSSAVVRYGEINTDHFAFLPRLSRPRLLKAERTRSFSEIDMKISANLAMREAERCFNCGICNQCDNCRLFCPDLAVIRDNGPQGRRIDYDYCKGCGICVVECPRHAMTLEEEQGQEGREGQG